MALRYVFPNALQWRHMSSMAPQIIGKSMGVDLRAYEGYRKMIIEYCIIGSLWRDK